MLSNEVSVLTSDWLVLMLCSPLTIGQSHPRCLVVSICSPSVSRDNVWPVSSTCSPLTTDQQQQIFFQNLRFLFALTRRSWVAPLWSPRPVHWNVNYLPEPGRPETRSSIIYWSLVNCPPRLGINNSINLSWNLHHLAAWLPVTLCQTKNSCSQHW